MFRAVCNKITEIPVYDPKKDNTIIRYITKYPTVSYLTFVFIQKLLTRTYDGEDSFDFPNYLKIIAGHSFSTLFFCGVWNEYIPTNWGTIIGQGIVFSLMSDAPFKLSTCFYGVTRGLARRKYSLAYLMEENFLYVTSCFLLARWWLN